ncbi:MAG: ribosomal protein S18-alanine N-acetyltransferase [Promethearchaeota archaeon]
MKIKEVIPKDLNEIFNLEQAVFKEDAFSKELMKKLISKNIFFLKIEKHGIKKIVTGFVIVVKDREDRANIINLVIHPNYQNKGYGSLLLKETIKRIKELNKVNRIVLNVKVNNTSAIKLYKKFGFQIVQQIDNYYRSKEASYLMLKFLKK